MADIADTAADYQARHNAAALASRPGATAGRESCIECDEPISVLRQQLGARWCLDCQAEREQRARAQG